MLTIKFFYFTFVNLQEGNNVPVCSSLSVHFTFAQLLLNLLVSEVPVAFAVYLL